MLLAMIWKDLLVALKDKKSLIITICMPAILTTILGFAFSGLMTGNFSPGRAEIAVVNLGSREEDIEKIKELLGGPGLAGRLSEEQKKELPGLLDEMDFERILYEDLLGNPGVEKFIRYERMSLAEARALLEKGELAAAVVLPAGFTYNTFMNLALPFRNPVTIEVIKHPGHSIKGEMVSGIIKGFSDALAAGIIAKQVLLEAAIENNTGERAMEEIGGLIKGMYHAGVRDISIAEVTVEGKRLVSSFQYYAVGMAVMFILYAAANGAQYSIDEVNNGTYRRLIMAGAGRWRFFAARFVATALFILIQLAVLISYSRLVFKTDWGSPAGVAFLSVFLAVTVGSLAVLLAAINLRLKNSKASIVFQAVVIQAFALLGGSFFPVAGIPVMRSLGNLTVNGVAMTGYLKLMMGYGLADLTGTLATLSGMALVFFAAGTFAAATAREV